MLYAAHPVVAKLYVPASEFHRFTFEHKFGEMVSILMHLGGKTIDVEHVRGWGRDFAASLSVPIPDVPASATASVTAGSTVEQRLLYHAEFEGSCTPRRPDDLVWCAHEPTWQKVMEGRLLFGLKNFSLHLNYLDDYGINAGLKLKAERAGFELGGRFEQHEQTTWSIRGTFA